MGIDLLDDINGVSEFNAELNDLASDIIDKSKNEKSSGGKSKEKSKHYSVSIIHGSGRSRLRREIANSLGVPDVAGQLYEIKELSSESGRKKIFDRISRQSSLSIDDAKFLVTYYKDKINWLNIKKISADVLEFFYLNNIKIDISKLKTVNKDIISTIFKYADNRLGYLNIDLRGVENIDKSIAESLVEASRINNVELNISGVNNIDDEVLDILSDGNFNLLRLGIESLSNNQADILSKFKGYELDFDNISTISDYAVGKLIEKKKYIHFRSIKSLSDNQFDLLMSMIDEDGNHMVDFSDSVFETLTSHQIENGILDHYISYAPEFFTDDIAEALGKFDLRRYRFKISFSGIKSITDTQMHFLFDNFINRKDIFNAGRLDFSGLTSITNEQIGILAKIGCSLKLDGIKSLTDEQAIILKDNWHGVLQDCGEGTYSDAEISFDGLETISDVQLDNLLSISPCSINLSNIKVLSDSQVKILVKHLRAENEHDGGRVIDKNGKITDTYYYNDSYINIGCKNGLTAYQKELICSVLGEDYFTEKYFIDSDFLYIPKKSSPEWLKKNVKPYEEDD